MRSRRNDRRSRMLRIEKDARPHGEQDERSFPARFGGCESQQPEVVFISRSTRRATAPPCRRLDRSRQLPPANRISNEPLSLCASTNQFCNEGSLWRGRKPAPHLRRTRFELALTPCFRSPLNGTRRHYGNSKLIASRRNRPLAIKLRTTRV